MVQPFIRIAGRRINLTQLEQSVFMRSDVSKSDIITYYRTIARVMLRHVHDRPLTLERFPSGVEEGNSLMSVRPAQFPQWLPSARLTSPDGERTYDGILATTPADLIFLANQGMVALYMSLSRIDRPQFPDRLIFDLEPASKDFSKVPPVASRLKRHLESLGLTPFIQTTGSRGAQVHVPIKRSSKFEEVRGFAQTVARDIASSFPDLATVEKERGRGDRVFIDCSRNAPEGTVIVPYSLRGIEGAPVATPLDWKELSATDLTSQKYDIHSILRRLAQKSDPWEGMNRRASSLRKASERLDHMEQSGAA